MASHAYSPSSFLASCRLERAEEMLAHRLVDRALAGFAEAESSGADPERCAAGRWQCWMLKGDFERAWRENDRLRLRGTFDPNRFWNGHSLQGRHVMLRCLHGYGDAIQMLRYAPAIRRSARSLTVEAAPAMVPLTRCFPGVDEVITWGRDAPPDAPAWNTQVEVMELPYVFRSKAADLPSQVPYLMLPPEAPARRLQPERASKIGLFWAGGDWDRSRSIPFKLLEPLLRREGVSFWSLQEPGENSEWHDFHCFDDERCRRVCEPGVLALAHLIAQLDLVITIDSMAAHLAGALGRPVWTLLRRSADWRWMLDRKDSPWYPTMRLFRQSSDGDWATVVHEVTVELAAWLRTRPFK